MSLSDLTPGEKASLRAKLYDVQKQLNLLDIEREIRKEQNITFQPKFEAKYVLNDRENNFADTVKKVSNICS